jgi:hypothetical protein
MFLADERGPCSQRALGALAGGPAQISARMHAKNNNFTTSTSYNTKSPVKHRRNHEIYRNNERSGCFQIINMSQKFRNLTNWRFPRAIDFWTLAAWCFFIPPN